MDPTRLQTVRRAGKLWHLQQRREVRSPASSGSLTLLSWSPTVVNFFSSILGSGAPGKFTDRLVR